MITIDSNRCDGCGTCLDACNTGAIYLVEKKAHVDQLHCTLCGKCFEVCPVQAIQSVESVVVRPRQPAEIQPAKTSVLPAIKAAIVTLGSTLLPVVISKIGDVIAAFKNNTLEQCVMPGCLKGQGRGKRSRHGWSGFA